MQLSSCHPAYACPSQPAKDLHPAEDGLDATSDDLTDLVSAVTRGSSIDCGPFVMVGVDGDVRCHAELSTLGDEAGGVVALVAATVLRLERGSLPSSASASRRSA